MADRKYCLCCGEDVPFNRVQREGRTELTCAFCGFTLDVAEEPLPARGSTIFLADDSRVTRDLPARILLSRGIAPDVRSFPDGTAFVSAVSKLFSDHQTLSLAILDLNMPGMDGLTAARTLRALEGQLGLERTPLIFFRPSSATRTSAASSSPQPPLPTSTRAATRSPTASSNGSTS